MVSPARQTHALERGDQLLHRLDRPVRDQRARDAAGEGHAAAAEQLDELGLLDPRQQLGGGLAAAAVEPHVERHRRVAGAERQPALGGVELRGADAQVEQHPVDRRHAGAGHHLAQEREARVEEARGGAEARELLLGDRQHLRVAVEPDQHAVRAELLEDRRSVSAVAGGGVDHALAGPRREQLQHLVDHHRPVRGAHRAPRSSRECWP